MLIDNKKTREISWNDFELEGNKENLIKEGWESFEPYGFGEFIGKAPEEVFEKEYSKNYLINGEFKGVIGDKSPMNWSWRDHGSTPTVAELIRSPFGGGLAMHIKTDNSRHYLTQSNNYLEVKEGDTVTVSADVLGDDLEMWVNFYDDNMEELRRLTRVEFEHESNVRKYVRFVVEKGERYFELYRIGVGVEGNRTGETIFSNIHCSVGENIKFYPNWQDLPEEEKSVNAYEKGYTYVQPLNNDFTRIRTKGGDTDMKLKSPNFGQLGETGTNMTISLYVENNSDSMIRFSNNLAIGGEPYPDGAEYMITVPREYKGFAYLKGEKVDGTVELDIRSDGNIDMIVSQPEIIEGHNLNAMLLIEDLEDGRKHVQVHNVNENTKLVYTGGGVIKGEPYTLETEIENDGRIFNLSANMFDDKVEVQKGMNNIRKSGELQDKELKIEIGVD